MSQQPQTVSVTIKNPTTGDESVIGFHVQPRTDGGNLWRKVTAWHWQFIQPGWGESEVRKLLGGPVKIKPAKGPDKQPVTVWKYDRAWFSSAATVTFSEGKVIGFQAPSPYVCRWVDHGPVEGA